MPNLSQKYTSAGLRQPPKAPPAGTGWRDCLLPAALIVLTALAAYRNSFAVPFTFDDATSITENPSIRRLWALGEVLSPPHTVGLTVSGRPLLNLSFAINYALGGAAVQGYHRFNLAIHVLGGLTLLGIVRRTLLQPVLRARFGAAATLLALAAALLWTVHPLQTEAVTYTVQRAESLMGLLYLLTLYCGIRGMDSPAPGRWQTLAVTASLLGMACKEVMVTAPVLVLLYDRTFVAGTFREAWRRRRRLYLGLAATWLLLGGLVASTGNRGGTSGLGIGVAWWAYGLTQFRAMAYYLWLSLWPHPLVFEYGTEWITRAGQVVPYALVVVPLAAGTLIALRRRPVPGYAAGWFFGILALTSLVPGKTQMIVEHRMYLPLAGVIALGVPGIYVLAGRRSLLACVALAAGLAWLTSQRNEDYRSELSLWYDTVAKRPGNARAQYNLGVAYTHLGRLTEAITRYEEALRIQPDYADPHNNLGAAFAQMGRVDEAMAHFAEALRINPHDASAHYNLARGLAMAGQIPEAIFHYEAALRITPADAEIHYNLGNVYLRTSQLEQAIEQYEQALQLRPDYERARQNLARARGLQQASGFEN
jgi:Flp pilus assembly protein TadD